MSANYKQLENFTRRFEALSEQHQDAFMEACCKELAARLLAKVIKRTPVGDYSKEVTVVAKKDSKKHKKGETYTKKVSKRRGGTLRRGWTAGTKKSATDYANSLNLHHFGDTYQIDIINPVEYASYVEYGHRTANHQGWVPGHFMLTISEEEIRRSSQKILQNKLSKFMKDVFP